MFDKYSNLSLKVKTGHLQQVSDYVKELNNKPDLRSLFIEMTLNCNEHCRHCGSRCGDIKMKDQLTDKEILTFLTDLSSRMETLPFLNITGGEPMLRPGFIDLMRDISDLGFKWGMTTNGTLINDSKVVDRLIDAGLRTISISIDGLRSTHDWFRQTKGGYDKSINAIKLLVEKKKSLSNIMVTTVVHRENVHELEMLYKEIKDLGIDTWRIINLEPIGRAKDNAEIALVDNDYKVIVDFIKKYRKLDNELEITFGCNHWLGIQNEHRLRNWYFRCDAGTRTGGIFYNGDIGGCLDIERRPETIQGNIRTDDFISVWENKFQVFRKNRALESDFCRDCKDKEFCRGDGFHTWDLDNNRPNLCMHKIVNGCE